MSSSGRLELAKNILKDYALPQDSLFMTMGLRIGSPLAVQAGIAQAIAILPDINRSGATISTSVLLGIDRAKTAKFSFLMVVPLIFGKIAKDLLDGELTSDTSSLSALSLGFIVSFITGIFACTWMIKIVKKSQLKYFAYYCLIVGIPGIAYVNLS